VNSEYFQAEDDVNTVMDHNSSALDLALGVFVWNKNYVQKILNELKKKIFG